MLYPIELWAQNEEISNLIDNIEEKLHIRDGKQDQKRSDHPIVPHQPIVDNINIPFQRSNGPGRNNVHHDCFVDRAVGIQKKRKDQADHADDTIGKKYHGVKQADKNIHIHSLTSLRLMDKRSFSSRMIIPTLRSAASRFSLF
jgi:hypothetical protein